MGMECVEAIGVAEQGVGQLSESCIHVIFAPPANSPNESSFLPCTTTRRTGGTGSCVTDDFGSKCGLHETKTNAAS